MAMNVIVMQLPIEHPQVFRGTRFGEAIPPLNEYKECYKESFDCAVDLTNEDELFPFLDYLFERYNIYHPEDYNTRSLSVSDIIKIELGEEAHYYYVDNIGFKEIN